MTILGIDEITFGVTDLEKCRLFFEDWGLTLVASEPPRLVFECLNGCRVVVAHSSAEGLPAGAEPDPTLREVVWGVASADELEMLAERLQGQPEFVRTADRVGCTDPSGLAIRIQVTRKRDLRLECAQSNTWSERLRIDQAGPSYERAHPIEVGHVVFFTRDLARTTDFYEQFLGFVVSDRYPGRGHFLRCSQRGGHHDLFLLQLPQARNGLNHVAFSVRDIHEVFGGGMHMSRCGWTTELGPGRHPISSAIFWYVNSPAGALVEYCADEDELTEKWQPREFVPGPTVFAEWAIQGGIDGHTRRQLAAEAPGQRFMTDKSKS
jgi:catechol 2,3-dioxygenase-like lactoylglutathione lyase family enzyme